MSNEITIRPGNGVLTAFQNLPQLLEVADKLASSTIVPQAYQKQPGNVLIALNTAQRLQVDPLMVMQNLYVVYGNPSWSGQFALALLRNSSRYSKLEYVNLNGTDWRGGLKMRGYKWDGSVEEGPEITPELVSKAGWDKKNGNKWNEMPEQMFRYRAASWFAKSCCPEVLLGLPTVDEVRDEGPREMREAKVSVVGEAAPAAAATGLGVAAKARKAAADDGFKLEGQEPEVVNSPIALPQMNAADKVKAALRAAKVKWEVFAKWLAGRSVTVPAAADREQLVKLCEWLLSGEHDLLEAAAAELNINWE